MHVLPQLRRLEESFHRELVVVGVHSPKYRAERELANLRQAVLRLEIQHPVVSDPNMILWSEYAVRAWPTLMLVDPAGKLIGRHEGEFRFEEFQPLVAAIVSESDARGMLDRRPFPLRPEHPPDSPLLFPGKVLADAASGRLFVADSGHDRVVVATLDGQVRQIVGGRKGFRDGASHEAAFHKPQGMALDGDLLYVADTWNHAIRCIDLTTGRVATVAGTGEQMLRVKEGPARSTPLNSPWALAIHRGVLYVAMAGSHQIWAFDPSSGEMARYAGTGREALVDGTLARSTFAQPSGLTTDGQRLYVADTESNAIRAVDLPNGRGQVRTLVGLGLFDFGDADGTGDQVRLQHPTGICFDASTGTLLVADSYNSKIKRLDPHATRTVTLLGSGLPGLLDGAGSSAALWEPTGLSMIPGRLYVADANNHAVRVVELDTLRVSTLEFPGLSP